MIACKPSPVQPNFSFSKYDGIVIGQDHSVGGQVQGRVSH